MKRLLEIKKDYQLTAQETLLYGDIIGETFYRTPMDTYAYHADISLSTANKCKSGLREKDLIYSVHYRSFKDYCWVIPKYPEVDLLHINAMYKDVHAWIRRPIPQWVKDIWPTRRWHHLEQGINEYVKPLRPYKSYKFF